MNKRLLAVFAALTVTSGGVVFAETGSAGSGTGTSGTSGTSGSANPMGTTNNSNTSGTAGNTNVGTTGNANVGTSNNATGTRRPRRRTTPRSQEQQYSPVNQTTPTQERAHEPVDTTR